MQSRVLSVGHPPRSGGWFVPRRSVWAVVVWALVVILQVESMWGPWVP